MEGYIKNGTQENMILDYIEKNGCITNLRAILDLGIMQCPARIWGLKRRGYDIRTRRIWVQDRYGQNKQVVEYFLHKENA